VDYLKGILGACLGALDLHEVFLIDFFFFFHEIGPTAPLLPSVTTCTNETVIIALQPLIIINRITAFKSGYK
jgi:hypothetical protein